MRRNFPLDFIHLFIHSEYLLVEIEGMTQPQLSTSQSSYLLRQKYFVLTILLQAILSLASANPAPDPAADRPCEDISPILCIKYACCSLQQSQGCEVDTEGLFEDLWCLLEFACPDG